MIFGVGVDVVSISRMQRTLERTPRFETRVFTKDELATASDRGSRTASLAARFAAKEACRKALRRSVPWHDVEVVSAQDGSPHLRVEGHDSLTWHVSLSHDADVAVALVVAERG